MRRLLTVIAATCLAVLVSAAPASGQSLAWSGFYVGGYVGFGMSNPDAVAAEHIGIWNGSDGPIAASGGVNWGGFAGYQRAITRRFVVAGEFALGMNGYSGDGAYDAGSGNDTKTTYEGGFNWTGLGRVGYVFGPVMPYFTLGAVGISTDVEALDDCNTGSCGGGLAHATASGSTTDFTWGFGAEFGLGSKIGGYPLTIRGEFLFSQFRTIIDATDAEQEITWRFNPHYPQSVIRIMVNWRIAGSDRR
jgi:hypothetical protein